MLYVLSSDIVTKVSQQSISDRVKLATTKNTNITR